MKTWLATLCALGATACSRSYPFQGTWTLDIEAMRNHAPPLLTAAEADEMAHYNTAITFTHVHAITHGFTSDIRIVSAASTTWVARVYSPGGPITGSMFRINMIDPNHIWQGTLSGEMGEFLKRK
jgi:hypothetical protein